MKKYRWILGGCVYLFLSFLSVSGIQAETTKPQTVEQAYPGLATNILKGAKLASLKKGTLLVSDGIEIRESQIKEIVEKAKSKIQAELRKNLFSPGTGGHEIIYYQRGCIIRNEHKGSFRY